MSKNLRDFVKAIYGFDGVVRRTPAAGWAAPSACDDWTGADVVDHVVGVVSGVTAMAAGTPPPEPVPSDDRAADWAAARDGLLVALDEPGCLQREGETPFGTMTVDRFIGILGVDPLCHTFDLAVAAGVDPALDPALVERYHGQLTKAGDAVRIPGFFGAEAEAPADATPAEAFIAFTGRNPRP